MFGRGRRRTRSGLGAVQRRPFCASQRRSTDTDEVEMGGSLKLVEPILALLGRRQVGSDLANLEEDVGDPGVGSESCELRGGAASVGVYI